MLCLNEFLIALFTIEFFVRHKLFMLAKIPPLQGVGAEYGSPFSWLGMGGGGSVANVSAVN